MNLPGNSTHQQILKTFIDLFKKDSNARAFIIFGSLVRGNWDNYSDLDLDVIVHNASREKISQEKNDLIEKLNETFKVYLCFEESINAFVFILNTLDRISIRFHLLEDTHPSILDSMKILCGDLSPEQIKSSQNLNLKKDVNLKILHNKFLEHSIYFSLSLKRNRPINAFFFLNALRQTIIEIYTQARQKRIFDFEEIADDKIKLEISKTYTSLESDVLTRAFQKLIELYKNSIDQISAGQLSLTDDEKLILDKTLSY